MPKKDLLKLATEFYEHPATTRVRLTKENADSILRHYSGWIIINEVVWYLRTRPCDDGQVELRLEQAEGLD